MNEDAERDELDDTVGRRDTDPQPRRPNARVLVADDDAAMRNLVCAALADEGYEVDEVASGLELLRAIEKSTLDAWPLDGVDLIVSDLRMPGLTGLDVMRKLHAAHTATPMILMTAFAEAEIFTLAKRYDVPVLSKPFSLERLRTTVASVLKGASSTVARDSRNGFRWW